MGRHLRPLAASLLGMTAELRCCLTRASTLRQTMLELVPWHAELYARFADVPPSVGQGGAAEGDGQRHGQPGGSIGVRLPRFVALAELVVPTLPRALVVHAFAMCWRRMSRV